jgi:CRISPR system Cascade subunit CasE
VTSLQLLSMRPSLEHLAAYAARRHLLPESGSDFGYAFHHCLTAVFGEAAPSPFRFLQGRAGPQLLAYSAYDEGALRDYAALQSAMTPHHDEAAEALGVKSLLTKKMPELWSEGRKYRFDARLRPVVRTTRNDDRKKGGGREIDAFVAAVAKSDGAKLDRETIYKDWTEAAFARVGGAALYKDALQIVASRRTRLHTRTRSNHLIEGPDVAVKGLLRVDAPDAFAALVARGIGRHRSFGFGMLLLSPAA